MREMRHSKLWLGIAAIALTISTLVSHPIAAQTEESYSPEEIADLRTRAESGDADAQNSLGYMYGTGKGVAQDYQQAAYWYHKAAAQGDVDAQYLLGLMYDNGEGVAQDDRQAAHWYRKAAMQGDAIAQNNVGDMYYTGQEVTQNYKRAYFWFSLAIAQGFTLSSEDRDIVAKNLSPQEIAQMDELVKQCAAMGYKNCREP